MAEDQDQDVAEAIASRDFLRSLKDAGFFQQIKNLEGSLKVIAGDLKGLAETATKRLEEQESIAAYLLALESVLTVLIRDKGVDAEAVRRAAMKRTGGLSDQNGSPAVMAIIEDILGRVKE